MIVLMILTGVLALSLLLGVVALTYSVWALRDEVEDVQTVLVRTAHQAVRANARADQAVLEVAGMRSRRPTLRALPGDEGDGRAYPKPKR